MTWFGAVHVAARFRGFEVVMALMSEKRGFARVRIRELAHSLPMPRRRLSQIPGIAGNHRPSRTRSNAFAARRYPMLRETSTVAGVTAARSSGWCARGGGLPPRGGTNPQRWSATGVVKCWRSRGAGRVRKRRQIVADTASNVPARRDFGSRLRMTLPVSPGAGRLSPFARERGP